MTTFSIGDIVTLKKGQKCRNYGASPGMRAHVYRVTREHLYVTWLDKTTQSNGNYPKQDFILIDKQLKFEFMNIQFMNNQREEL